MTTGTRTDPGRNLHSVEQSHRMGELCVPRCKCLLSRICHTREELRRFSQRHTREAKYAQHASCRRSQTESNESRTCRALHSAVYAGASPSRRADRFRMPRVGSGGICSRRDRVRSEEGVDSTSPRRRRRSRHGRVRSLAADICH
jgi:hypothetical protein